MLETHAKNNPTKHIGHRNSHIGAKNHPDPSSFLRCSFLTKILIAQ
jgi:hypothetical protein